MLPTMLTVLLGPAFGHVPHDPIVALAAPADLAEGSAWWLLAAAHDFDEICRSEDGGRTWSFVGGAPLSAGPLLDAAMLSDGTVALLAAERLWLRTPGADWEALPVPAGLREIEGGDSLILAGDAGIWTIDPPAPELGRRIARLAAGPVALDESGEVWARRSGAWTSLGRPAPDPVAVLGVGDVAFVGTTDGRVLRWGGGSWGACGALPASDSLAEVVALAWDGARILAAPAWHGPFASSDDCRTWEDASGGLGQLWSAADADGLGERAWRVFAAHGDRWILGGWSGLFTTGDAGATWNVAPFLPPATARGIAFLGDPDDGGTVAVATYAAGIGVADPTGERLLTPGHGLPYSNTQWVTTTSDGERLYALAGHRSFVSEDGGSSWRRLLPAVDHLFAFYAWDDVLWALKSSSGAPILESADGGGTWVEPPGLAELVRPATPMRAASCEGACAGQVRCVTTLEPATLVCLQAGAWERLYAEPREREAAGCGGESVPSEPATRVTAPVLWPATAPIRVLFGHDSGLEVLSLDGAETRTAHPAGGDPPMSLALADDGTVLLATRSGRMLESPDGGDTWIDLALRLPAVPLVIAPWPRFASTRSALVGTPDGIWRIDFAAASGLRWAPVDRVDSAAAQLVVRSGPRVGRADDEADLDDVRPLEPGTHVEAWVRGHTVSARGASEGTGAVELRVDGMAVATIGADATDGIVEIARIEGLEDGWHRVELLGLAGTGVVLDALEGRAEPAAAEAVEPAGCASGGSATLALALMVARRRRAYP